jgi:hypothetical protein
MHKRQVQRFCRMALAVFCAGRLFQTVQAAEPEPTPGREGDHHPLLNDTLRISLGAFFANATTSVRLDGSRGLGTEINFEEVLGLEKQKLIGEAGLAWRFAERWRFDADYFSLSRSATRTISKQIEWGDQVYSAGSEVSSEFKITDLRTGFGYSFFRRPDKELGFGLGLHRTTLQASVTTQNVGAEAVDVFAPLPVVTAYSNIALTDTWAMRARMDWLSLTYGKYDGGIRTVVLDVLYQPFRYVGFGLGWHSLAINVGVQNPHSHAELRMVFDGPALFMNASF